jgi:mRNA interferase RelE/StbE
MHTVVIEKEVIKQLSRIPSPDYKKIKIAINALADEPRPHGCLKLKGRAGYRIRIGNYRVIYEIEDNVLKIFILTVAHRKDVYE